MLLSFRTFCHSAPDAESANSPYGNKHEILNRVQDDRATKLCHSAPDAESANSPYGNKHEILNRVQDDKLKTLWEQA